MSFHIGLRIILIWTNFRTLMPTSSLDEGLRFLNRAFTCSIPCETHPIFHFATTHRWFKIRNDFKHLSRPSWVNAERKNGSDHGGLQQSSASQHQNQSGFCPAVISQLVGISSIRRIRVKRCPTVPRGAEPYSQRKRVYRSC